MTYNLTALETAADRRDRRGPPQSLDLMALGSSSLALVNSL